MKENPHSIWNINKESKPQGFYSRLAAMRTIDVERHDNRNSDKNIRLVESFIVSIHLSWSPWGLSTWEHCSSSVSFFLFFPFSFNLNLPCVYSYHFFLFNMFSFRKWIAARITPGSNSNDQNESRRRSDPSANSSSSYSPINGSLLHLHLRLPDDFDSTVASGFNHTNSSINSRHNDSTTDRCTNFIRPIDLTVLHFYKADAELNEITAELDSFEGKNEPVRCAHLVNQLR